MRAATIAVGSELLSFGRPDGNGLWLAEALRRRGVPVVMRTAVDDDPARIEAVMRRGLDLADVVIVTGGIGPTEDDRTRAAASAAVDLPLEQDPEMVELLQARYAARGYTLSEDQARQAERPRAASWLANPVGAAPGFLVEHAGSWLICLPGVPSEMREMFDVALAPRLDAATAGAILSRRLRVAGRSESSVDRLLRDLYDAPGVEVTVLGSVAGVEVQIVARAGDQPAARSRLEAVVRPMLERLGESCYGDDDTTLAEVVGRRLRRCGMDVAVAESCTAGLLGAALTEPAGASAWFRGGIQVYSDAMKTSLAGVPAELIAEHGAVSEPVARALARGVRERSGSAIGVGVTGVAGPGGGSESKPVGTVHLALDRDGVSLHRELRLPGDRQAVRLRSVAAALDELRRWLGHGGGG